MKNCFFKASLNIMSFITETAVSCSILSVKNTNILFEFAVKIRNVIFVKLQNMMIIIVFSEINQTNIVV